MDAPHTYPRAAVKDAVLSMLMIPEPSRAGESARQRLERHIKLACRMRRMSLPRGDD